MSDQHGPDPGSLGLELARIDAVCLRFEADWRAGRRPLIDDYLGVFSDEETKGADL
jgi:hypothetical protein